MTINKGLFSSNTSEWETPTAFFKALDAEFHFTLDPCATHENAKCKRYYTIEDDGLTQNWGGAESLLQPSVWSQNQGLGQEVLPGVQNPRHYRCYAHSCKDRHLVFS